MAGTNPDFNPTAFRDGLRFAFNMAAAPIPDEQVIFHFPANLVYVGNVDASGVPFDPNTTVQPIEPPTVKVPCAVEYDDTESVTTNFGWIAPARVRITLLDEEYQKVKGCSYVTIAGDKYNYRRTEPPSGLFDVGLYTMHFTAENET
jgi:hypothetical protein